MNAPARNFDLPAPVNIDAEQGLLGAILMNSAAYHAVAPILRAEHFSEPLHSAIYDAAAAMIEKGQRVNPIIIKDHVPARVMSASGEVDTWPLIAHIAASALPAVTAASTARQVVELSLRRHLMSLGRDLTSVSGNPPVGLSASGIIAEMEQRLFGLTETVERLEGENRPAGDYAAVIEAIRRRKANPHASSAVMTGLSDLDRKIGGFEPGDFILLAGRPGMGKTAFALSMARRASRVGGGVAFDSIEMPEDQVNRRLLADEAFSHGRVIPYFNMRTGNVSDADLETIERAREALEKLPLVVLDHGGARLSDLPGHIRQARKQLEAKGSGLSMFIIDYLGLVRPGDRYSGSRVNEVSEISAHLKALARRERIPIIALHQLSRAVEGRDDKRPQLSDLRDSGSLEQDADIVMFCYREHYYLNKQKPEADHEKEAQRLARLTDTQRELEIVIAKQRAGSTGIVTLWCDIGLNAVRDAA